MDADTIVFDCDCVPAPIVNDFPSGLKCNPSSSLRRTGITTPRDPETINNHKHVFDAFTLNFDANH
jgi:hypothetical protein